jgi:hypothetical protein
MYCRSCGEQIDDGSRFCRHCGARQQVQDIVHEEALKPADWSVPSAASPAARQPANKTGKTVGIGAAALLGLIVLGSIAGGSNQASVDSNAADLLADNMEMQADNMEAMSDAVAKQEPSSPWSYSTDVDKVRGGTSYFATTTSTNTVHQDPPYDADTTMRMTVRQMPSSGTDVVLNISSGQLMCPSYEGCSGTVRFDRGPAQRVRFNGPADNSSDTIFVVGAKTFVSKLKKAKKVIIEKTLYEAGEPQFEFDVSGLKWQH